MEAENQQNEAIENAPENTLQVEEITDSEENTQDTLDLIKEEIVIVVDHKATRLDKNNLKKLKKMSDKVKEKEKKAKEKQKEKEKKAKKKKKEKAKKEKKQKKLKEKKAKKKAASKNSKKKSKKK